MTEEISLGSETPVEEPVSMNDAGYQAPPPQKVATQRATKFHIALGDQSPGLTSLQEEIMAGREPVLRQNAATKEQLRWQQQKNDLILEVAKKRGGNFSPEEHDILQSMTQQDFAQDPQTVFEKKFAEKYVTSHVADAQTRPNNVYSSVSDRVLAENIEMFTKHAGENQVWQTWHENLKQQYNSTGLRGWEQFTDDIIKELIPGFSAISYGNQTPGSPATWLSFTGQNIREQVTYIRSLPIEQGMPLAQKVVAELHARSPLQAMHFADALMKYSTSDEYWDSSTNIADLAILPIGGMLRATGKTIKRVAGVSEPGPRVIPLPAWNEIRQSSFGNAHPLLAPKKGEGPVVDIPNLGLKGGREKMDEAAFGPVTRPSAADVGKQALREDIARLPRVPGDDLPSDQQFLKAWDRRIEAQAVADVRGALEDTVRAVEKPNANVIDIVAESGDIEKAGWLAAFKRFGSSFVPDAEGVITLERDLASFANPWNFYGGAGAMANTHATKLVDAAARRMENILDAFGQGVRGTRLTPEATKVALDEAAELLKHNHLHKVNDGFLDIVTVPADLNPAGVNVAIMRMGRPGDAAPFASRAEAKHYAEDIYQLTDGEYRVYRQGKSFYIGIPEIANESSPGVLTAMHTPTNATPRSGMFAGLLDRLRTSEDLLSLEHSAQRKVAQHGQQVFRQALIEAMAPMKSLGRRQRNEVEQILELNRDGPPTNPNQTRGNWYETAADFENAFFTKHRKQPTREQTEAYYAYRQVSDMEYLMANITLYRDKAITGMKQFSLKSTDGVAESFFEGIQRKQIPWDLADKMDFNIGVFDTTTKTLTTGWAKAARNDPLQTVNKKYVDDLLNQGYELIQISFPSTKPLKRYAPDEEINFLLTNASTSKPLSWHQVDYNPGGHVIYPYQWYVKQPLLAQGREGKLYYHGDATMMNFSTEAQARKYAERVDVARDMLLRKDPGLDAYLARNLPYTPEAFAKMFSDGRFSLDQKFAHTQSGVDVFATNEALARAHPNAVSYRNNPLDMNNFLNRQYVTDRDALISTVKETGDVLQIVPAKQLDPYQALQAGLNQRIKNVWMNDYKHMAVKSWIEEFKDVLDHTPQELRAHPYQIVNNPKWKDVGGSDMSSKLAAAKASQRSITNFIGTQSTVGELMTAAQNRLIDTIYNKAGQQKAEYFADYLLPMVKDPAAYFRGFAFHMRLGLFNPLQIVMQAQSINHVIAVAGIRNGYAGASAMPFMMALAHTNEPAIVKEAARKASKMGAGWTPAQFEEMYGAFRQSGLYEVMSEAALRNDLHDQKFFKSAVGYTLDKGAWMFNTGERMVRLTAFATAYMEASKAAAKAGTKLAIDDRTIASMMQRADLLSVNMTKGSLADFQKGILATPIQFATYQFRLAEQLLGKRLTTAEKMHAYAWYALMYGMPMSAGAGGVIGAAAAGVTTLAKGGGPLDTAVATAGGAIGMWPTYEDIRAEARKRNIDMSPMWIQGLANGLPALLHSLATGKEFDFALRMGPGSGTMVKDIWHGEDSIVTATGASGQVISDLLRTVMPLKAAAVGMVMGGDAGPQLNMSDLNRVLKNVSTWDMGSKVFGVMQYGKHYDKRGQEIGKADTVDAVMGMMGLTPLHIKDVGFGQKATKEIQRAQQKFEDAAIEEYRLSLQYGQQGDKDKANMHYRNAAAYLKLGDFNPTRQLEVLKKALRTLQPMEDRVDRDLYRKSQQRNRLDTLDAFINKQR